MTTDKDAALMLWASELPGAGAVLLNFLSEYSGSTALAVAPETQGTANIDGSRQRSYLFNIQIMRPLSHTSDDINAESMALMRAWQDWIDAQEEAGNYPDFGPKCSCYELQNLADNPSLAMTYTDEQMAKYQFPALLTYLEEV